MLTAETNGRLTRVENTGDPAHNPWLHGLWVELVFECTNCEWSQVVARYPAGIRPTASR